MALRRLARQTACGVLVLCLTTPASADIDFGINTCILNPGMVSTIFDTTFHLINNSGETWVGGDFCQGFGSECPYTLPCQNYFTGYTGDGSGALLSGKHIAVSGILIPPGGVYTVTIGFDGNLNTCTTLFDPVCLTELTTALLLFDDPAPHGDVALGESGDVTYVLSNVGSDTATGLALSGLSGDWSIFSTSCGTTLAAESSCSVTVRFTPTSVGSSADELLVDYDDGTGPAATVSKGVSGQGVATPVPALPWLALLLLVAMLAGVARGPLRRLQS